MSSVFVCFCLFFLHVINGCFYKKLKVPDLSGSTTGSLTYLTHVNTRGIVIINTDGKSTDTKQYTNIGSVACIPIGMCEVSSVKFDPKFTTPEKPVHINKGHELDYFQFGGSSFAIVCQDVRFYKKKITVVEKCVQCFCFFCQTSEIPERN